LSRRMRSPPWRRSARWIGLHCLPRRASRFDSFGSPSCSRTSKRCLRPVSVGDRKVFPSPASHPRNCVPENDSEKSLPTLASKLLDLVRAYAKQETVEPLRGVGRFVAFGLAGSFLVGIGLVLLALGALRALQNETGT